MNTIGNRIEEERKKKNLSQRELGEIIGVNDTQISNYEKGISIPPSDRLGMMADIFSCTTDYLLCRTDNSKGYVTEININGNNIKITADKPITEQEAYEFFKQHIGK